MAVDVGFPSTSNQSMKGPAYVRPEMQTMFKVYERIRDALSGEDAVKAAREKYLPKPNAEDRSPENLMRYKSYLQRAVWYPATGRTMEGMIGQIFLRDPTFDLPSQLDCMELDASGDGQSLEQVARLLVGYVLGYGRAGILADYPNTAGEGVTKADVEAGDKRPTMKAFAPWHVPNWRTQISGAQETLSLVVIFEGFEVDDDGFERKYETQIRELRMVNGVCVATLWQRDSGRVGAGGAATGSFQIQEGPYTYMDADGIPLDHIPFTFVGSVSNNSAVDAAPFDGLASMNLAHFRNSADYEESAFICGQPTVVLSGLTEDWVKNVLKDKVLLGARSALMLPAGGAAVMLQAEPNAPAKEAMDGKERQMVALGAKLVQQAEVQRTATETDIESTAENSVLSAVAKNVKAGVEFALGECAAFAIPGADVDSIEFDLSTEFDLAKLDPLERAQLIKEWQSGAITFSEMRDALRAAGIASLPDDEAARLIAQEVAQQAAQAMATAAAFGTVGNVPGASQPGGPATPKGKVGKTPTPTGAGPDPTKFDTPVKPVAGS